MKTTQYSPNRILMRPGVIISNPKKPKRDLIYIEMKKVFLKLIKLDSK